MFIVKLMGVLDFLAGLFILLGILNIAPVRPALGLAMYLFIKGLIFFGDLPSFIDMFAGFFIILSLIFSFHGFFLIVSVLLILYLMQKAFVSIFYS